MSRPTKYTPGLADLLAAHMASGGTLTTFAEELGVDARTIRYWRRARPEIAAAINLTWATADTAPVEPRPAGSIVFSLAAWGVPMLPIEANGIARKTITEDDVDDMLARAA